MNPADKRERNFKLSKVIIDHLGESFFKGKKILDLGSGDGELANVFARLGATVVCCDAREENLAIIRKKFPHITTVVADLEKEFPFEPLSFDLVLSIDLLCHLKNYTEHLTNILNVSERIVLETEVLDTQDHSLLVPILESNKIEDLSFCGEGSLVSAGNIQNKIAMMEGKAKRIDETKLNHGALRYDWTSNNLGRRYGFRRLWIIRRDQHLAKLIKANREIKNQQEKEVRNKPVFWALKDTVGDAVVGETNIVNVAPMSPKDKRFVIVIPSYNNHKWCEKNIASALSQNYQNYRVIFTDDCSSDGTFELVERCVATLPQRDKCTLIRNRVRKGALENLYDMIHSCEDDEIILTLDGDDFFPDAEVLNRLERYYSTHDIWMSYGQYRNHPDGGVGIACQYPDAVVANGSFRRHPWGASHLRTFYTWLFKKIRKQDLVDHAGKFFSMSWDLTIQFPMMEMSGYRAKFISEIMYVYNMENPINDHKVDQKLQQSLDRHMRNMERYGRLEYAPQKKKVGLLLIATGKYDSFIQGLISSADQFFLTEKYDITYYIFTDSKIQPLTKRKFKVIPIKHRPFPYASMDRFQHFTNNANQLSGESYLYYCDVDSKFVAKIGEEIIGETVGVQHCGYIGQQGPYETNSLSTSFVSKDQQSTYFGGGFSGGTSEKYLALSKWCAESLQQDLDNNIIPVWHDESIINKYYSINKPSVILSPSFHYPESNKEHYRKIWKEQTFEPKILLLDKAHSEIRKDK